MKNYFFLLAIVLFISSCKEKYEFGESMTPSGYEYTVHTKGSGTKAKAGDFIKFAFEVIGDDGVSIQKSEDPNNYPIIQLPLEGDDTEANPVMDVFVGAMVGDSITVWMPIDSMPQPNPAFANLTHLKYVMSIRSIIDEATFKAEEDAKRAEAVAQAEVLKGEEAAVAELAKITLSDYKKGKIKVETTDSGLKYFIHEKGTGSITEKGQTATVNYYGLLTKDGSMFDNSYKRGQAFQFAAQTGSVIAGWDEAITTLPKGTKASLFIPSDLAYGASDRPGIPGGSELMFYVDIK